ncbi:MAG: hypothetical protein IJ007_09215 [Oscillospiraceae bacterium]|nr:hypothetical protein [Oscillospiraceae bacterium]
MRGRKKHAATAVAAGMFTLMLPLMAGAISVFMPSAADAICFAASASAKLTAYDFTENE